MLISVRSDFYMKVIKRGGQEVKFNLDKIKLAIIHANDQLNHKIVCHWKQLIRL